MLTLVGDWAKAGTDPTERVMRGMAAITPTILTFIRKTPPLLRVRGEAFTKILFHSLKDGLTPATGFDPFSDNFSLTRYDIDRHRRRPVPCTTKGGVRNGPETRPGR